MPSLTGPAPPLARARELAARREWSALAEHCAACSDAELRAEPELGFLCADACLRTGRPEQALERGAGIEPALRRRGERALLLNLLNVVGAALFQLGRTAAAHERFGELLELASEWGNEEFAARASNNLGVLANVRGEREAALAHYQRALASYQRLGYVRGLAQTHHNLGISYRDLGHAQEADAHYQRAIELAAGAQSEDVIAQAESERALLRASAGDGKLAEALARRALRRFERLGDPLGSADALRVLAAAARARREPALAATHLQHALAIARAHSDPLLLAEVQRDRGLLLRDQDDAAAARAALGEARDAFAALGAAADEQALQRLLDSL